MFWRESTSASRLSHPHVLWSTVPSAPHRPMHTSSNSKSYCHMIWQRMQKNYMLPHINCQHISHMYSSQSAFTSKKHTPDMYQNILLDKPHHDFIYHIAVSYTELWSIVFYPIPHAHTKQCSYGHLIFLYWKFSFRSPQITAICSMCWNLWDASETKGEGPDFLPLCMWSFSCGFGK